MSKSTNSSTASLEKDRVGGCILTASGLVIYPMDARPDEIVIEDVAGATAKLCRYTGHVRKFYSVAEHSVRVSRLLEERYDDPKLSYNGLMHDSAEAYLGDIARPVKKSGEIGSLYEAAEDALMGVLATRFNFEWPMSDYVWWADDVLLHTEQRDLMPYPNSLYSLEGQLMLDEQIRPWSPERAERNFLKRYYDLLERL